MHNWKSVKYINSFCRYNLHSLHCNLNILRNMSGISAKIMKSLESSTPRSWCAFEAITIDIWHTATPRNSKHLQWVQNTFICRIKTSQTTVIILHHYKIHMILQYLWCPKINGAQPFISCFGCRYPHISDTCCPVCGNRDLTREIHQICTAMMQICRKS
jgi:hypothetical protein